MNRFKNFFAGIIFALAIEALFQDLIGVVNYCTFVQNVWISPFISMPIEIGLLILACLIVVKNKKI
jgi:hypothetical protein